MECTMVFELRELVKRLKNEYRKEVERKGYCEYMYGKYMAKFDDIAGDIDLYPKDIQLEIRSIEDDIFLAVTNASDEWKVRKQKMWKRLIETAYNKGA